MIKLSKSFVGNAEIKEVTKVLKKGFLGMGTKTHHFESILSGYFNRHVACVANGTAAIQLALQAHDIKKGDEVIVSTLTFVATFQAISALGAKPVPCDIDNEDLTITSNFIEKKITKKTKAIIPVHFGGHVGKLSEIYQIAKRYNLIVIEDAAHAFGSVYKRKLIGSFGDTVCFSFDGIKNLTSGEGGCIVSKDKQFINRIKAIRKLSLVESKNHIHNFDVFEQGWRYHMSDIMAAVGIAQFRRFENMKKKRQELAKRYDLYLSNNSKIKVYKRNYDEIVPHIYLIKLKQADKANNLRKELLKKQIETGLHYFPSHLYSFYKSHKNILKNAESIYKYHITLPLHPNLTFKNIENISQKLLNILNK